ncbi:putative NOT transcription complex subunit VIP2 [Grifola frondosa]|uniref:Putative NOT transcription complex subunit VIP2 n=1 Tax=Grifola frondosa TaxID=5627 RepID=A0A1C7M2W5_GRIFR|nr:putative NOT transcription complex subunit VIP2 [Grifola frondosa]
MNRPGNRWNSRETVEMFTSRPGQPPQRPPSLAPNPALGGPFRGPYTGYGMPPRTVLPGFPNLPSHRTVVAQPSPNFIQRGQGQSNFPYGTGTLQQQQAQQSQPQLAAQNTLSHTPHQQQTQQPGASSTLPPHLAQNVAPSQGTAPSVSSASEVGLDLNDFPALGSTPATNSTAASSANTTSYASQAGTGAGASGVQASMGTGANQPRDFTPDDFPALGGQTQSALQTQQTQQQTADGHPPGLNGFQQHNDQHRQTVLGSLTGNAQTQQPGLLNLGQTRNIHPGFQTDAEKQRTYALKLNQNTHAAAAAAAAAAWNSPNANPGTQQASSAFPNGSHQNHTQTTIQQPQQQTQPTQHLNAPPGVPLPTTFAQPQPQAQQTPYIGNGTNAGDTPLHPSQGPSHATSVVPQTPAQQVLMSPADRWGLLGLLAMIKSADPDQNLLSIGTDLGTMGLDMQNSGLFCRTHVEPDFHLPTCYNVQPPPPGQVKRLHSATRPSSSCSTHLRGMPCKRLRLKNYGTAIGVSQGDALWLTKETGTSPSQKVPGGEQGTYSFWDPENWEKSRKEMTVLYADLEEKSHPLFAQSQTLQMNPTGQQTQHQQAQPIQRVGAFQGMGMGAM